ncbi:MAG: response regulator [Thermoproteota archaeon]
MDDDEGFNRSICKLLETRGHSTVSAFSGEEALQQLETEDVDLVLMDIRLPDSSGLELLEEVKDKYPDTGCIMITGYSSTDTAVESINLEAEAYLTKPIDPVALFEMVEKAIRKREKRVYEQRLEALHRHATMLAEAESMEEVAEITLDVLFNMFGFPHHTFFTVQEENVNPLMAQPSSPLSEKGESILVKAVNTGEVQVASDVDQDAEQLGEGETCMVSELAFPVKVDDEEVVAVIHVRSEELRGFTDQDYKLVETLATHVASAISRLRRMNTLEKAVEKRTEELREAYQELKELDKMKDQFMGMATHELRTPLVSIKGYIDYIQSGSAGQVPERIGELLDIVQRNTRRLESLTDDLLDQQRIESGRLEITPQPSDLREVIGDVGEEVEPMMEEKGQTLNIELPHHLPRLNLDTTRISQVLINLLSNASKFSPEHSPITLTAKEAEKHVKVIVEDRGIGLSPQDIDKLFHPFPDIDRPTVTEKSTGLGLSISKGILDLHGGKIWAESEGRGQGSTFTFTLPKQREEGVPSILLVDDEVDVRNLGKKILEEEGYTVYTAGEASQALTLAVEEQPDLILMDIVMPGRNGFDTCRELKLKPSTKQIPVVMFSVLNRDTDREMAAEAGADGYITKPFKTPQLLRTINKMLTGQKP